MLHTPFYSSPDWLTHTLSSFLSFSIFHYSSSAGQCYILSHDLAAAVAKEAPNSRSYTEDTEDHDISAMAFHTPIPVHMIVISRSQRFWEHPVKGEPRWKRIWKRESSRMQGIPFEGKQLLVY
jgi:hypothetical protein